jgi:hypothetical protein
MSDEAPISGERPVHGAPPGEPYVPASEPEVADAERVEEETVDGVPVLAEVRPLDRPPPASLPAVQAAAVAATGFVAGAATIALVKRHSARKLARSGRSASRRAADVLPIVGSRTFLIDVHLVGKPGE